MEEFIFELRSMTRWPFTDKRKKNQPNFGVLLTYEIFKVLRFTFFGIKVFYYKKRLGTKVFYRPLKEDWDKHDYRVPYAYWGKKGAALTRLWVILKSITTVDNCVHVITEESLINHKVTLFGKTFISHDLTKHLFKHEKKFTINSNH